MKENLTENKYRKVIDEGIKDLENSKIEYLEKISKIIYSENRKEEIKEYINSISDINKCMKIFKCIIEEAEK